MANGAGTVAPVIRTGIVPRLLTVMVFAPEAAETPTPPKLAPVVSIRTLSEITGGGAVTGTVVVVPMMGS